MSPPRRKGVEEDFKVMDGRLVLFAHGSADPVWQETFHKMVRELCAELGERSVAVAFMERAEPTLLQTIGRAAADGVRTVLVLPMFFSAGGHVSRDIPRLIEAARSGFPTLQIELLQPVGEHPSFVTLVGRIARVALGGDGKTEPLR